MANEGRIRGPNMVTLSRPSITELRQTLAEDLANLVVRFHQRPANRPESQRETQEPDKQS